MPNVTITIGDSQMFFVESTLSDDERDALLRQDKSALKDLPPDEAKKKEEELKKLDVRRAVDHDCAGEDGDGRDPGRRENPKTAAGSCEKRRHRRGPAG